MADTKISALPDGVSPQGTDIFPLVRGAGNIRLTLQSIIDAFNTLYDALGAATAAVAAHVGLADPHTQYQREVEKDAASGYAGLSAATKLAGAQQTYGAAANTACEGNDARLSDARTPTAHHATHEPGGSDPMAVDAAAVTGSLRTLGAGALQAASGTDVRFTDARTPLAHAPTHKSGGSDPIKLDELAAPTDIATLNASTAAHGLMQKYPGGTTTFLRADAAFAAVPGPVFNEFTKDLGAARTSGSFDITGLSGLTADKPVKVFQTAAKITSKGDSRDESEMDHIDVTGYVLDAATIRCYWNSINVVVGTYAFAYLVGA